MVAINQYFVDSRAMLQRGYYHLGLRLADEFCANDFRILRGMDSRPVAEHLRVLDSKPATWRAEVSKILVRASHYGAKLEGDVLTGPQALELQRYRDLRELVNGARLHPLPNGGANENMEGALGVVAIGPAQVEWSRSVGAILIETLLRESASLDDKEGVAMSTRILVPGMPAPLLERVGLLPCLGISSETSWRRQSQPRHIEQAQRIGELLLGSRSELWHAIVAVRR